MRKDKVIKFKDRLVILSEQEDGSYMDSKGTVYPAALFDPGFCGIWNIETGDWDPHHATCKAHDYSFLKLKAGYKDPDDSNLKVFGEFAAGIVSDMAKGAYSVLTGPLYLLFGGLGGILRWDYLERNQKRS